MHLKTNCKSQFLAVKDQANELLAKGYSKKTVYVFLTENEKIDMSYTSFLTMIRNHELEYPFKKKNPPKGQSRPQPQPIQSPVTPTVRGFGHENKPYLNTSGKKEDK